MSNMLKTQKSGGDCFGFLKILLCCCRNGERSAWSSTWERTTSSSRRARWRWATASTTWCDSRGAVATPRCRWTTSPSSSASLQVRNGPPWETGGQMTTRQLFRIKCKRDGKEKEREQVISVPKFAFFHRTFFTGSGLLITASIFRACLHYSRWLSQVLV